MHSILANKPHFDQHVDALSLNHTKQRSWIEGTIELVHHSANTSITFALDCTDTHLHCRSGHDELPGSLYSSHITFVLDPVDAGLHSGTCHHKLLLDCASIEL